MYSVCVTLYKFGPGHHTNLRPVSLEPSGPEPAILKKNLPQNDQWPNYRTIMLCH